MQFDYFIYVFLLIGFIYGLYRGLYRQLSFLVVFSICVFVPLYAYDFIKTLIDKILPIHNAYLKLHVLTDLVNMSEGGFEACIVIGVPFILGNIILNGILYLLIFRKAHIRRQSISVFNRLLGGVLGILVGAELSIIMVVFLNSIVSLDMSGPLSVMLLKIFKLDDILALSSQIEVVLLGV